ncbi:MAG: hypothetical protein PVF74_02970 [Anaerolineales bacterium]|jgi:hypothetical protein
MNMQMIHAHKHITTFFTSVSTERQKNGASLLVKSLRSFGGSLSHCPIWIFTDDRQPTLDEYLIGDGVQVLPLYLPETIKDYWFAAKVVACARAEELASSAEQSLVWMSTDSLIVKPPLLFDLKNEYDVALRPVHIRNIGSPATKPLDDFWRFIYETLRVQDNQSVVKSFVDDQLLRPYFNSHALSINPSMGIMRRWYEYFEWLVGNHAFQSGLCQDELHRIFLHQAVLSTLLQSMIEPERMRLLPDDYSYPYNLHAKVPKVKRAQALNDLVCFTYEDRSLHPDAVADIEIKDPLKSWLSELLVPQEE